MIPVLYCQVNSNYKKYNSCDIYDYKRDALTFKGNMPVICHPPCRLFSRLRAFSTAPACEVLHGFRSISLVRKNGGIVENPISSTLWKIMKVGSIQNPDEYGGYLIKIHLSDFGFQAQKATGLYIVGIPFKDLPALPLSFNAITHTVSTHKKSNLPELPKKERSTTPDQLIKWFIQIISEISRLKAGKSNLESF
jgi:hypothetical protein